MQENLACPWLSGWGHNFQIHSAFFVMVLKILSCKLRFIYFSSFDNYCCHFSADGMMFGGLSLCSLCSGFLRYSGGVYRCTGYISEWSKCSYSNCEPKRAEGKWKIPKETDNQYLKKVCKKKIVIEQNQCIVTYFCLLFTVVQISKREETN